jgi:hypothetical protein
MQAFSTSGSLSFAQTISRGAASWTSPFIVMAMGFASSNLRLLAAAFPK